MIGLVFYTTYFCSTRFKKKTCFSMALILLQQAPNSFSYIQRSFNYLDVKERMSNVKSVLPFSYFITLGLSIS